MSLEFCSALKALYNTKEVIGRSGQPFSALNGLSTVNNIFIIRQLILKSKPRKTLEVGLGCGGSALTFAASHRDLGKTPQKQHTAIDAFQTRIFDNVGRMQLEEAGLAGYVDVRESLSCYELARIADSGERFDMVYIDGSHQFADVFCDFYFVRILTAIDGLILFDDSSDSEVVKVIKYVQSNLSAFFRQIPIHRLRNDSLPVKLRYIIAEKLHRTQLTVFRKIKDS